MILFLDLETFSEEPIMNGTYRYVEGNVEVMISAWAIDDGPVLVADHTAGDLGPFDIYDVDDFEWIVIHGGNGPTFDRIVLTAAGVVEIPVEKVWDTSVQARSHGMPGGLDKLCQIFKVPAELSKHKDGKKLIQLFCKPRPKNIKVRRATRETHPVEWDRFLSYAGGDIHAMRYLWKKMPRWNYPTREHELWQLDQRINERGFKVDVELAEQAIEMIKIEKAKVDEKTQDATDGWIRSTTQRDALLRELLLEHGVSLPDLTKDTIERRLEDENLAEPVKELLRQRLLTSSTSTAKYNRILKARSSHDDRMRGSLLFCGAPRTKRWSGKIFQPQNLPRPDMDAEEIERGIEAIKDGTWPERVLEPMHLSWNALRGLIVAAPGNKLVQADKSQIEARVLPWLAEENWKLDAFFELDADTSGSLDMYKITAGRLLGKDPLDVTKDERQSHGKVVELACGYGGAQGAFAQFAALYGVDLPEHEVMEAVRGWREANAAIADWDDGLWARLDDAARCAVNNPGYWQDAGKYIKFKRYNDWLVMRLPSGGYLSYASPKIIPDPNPRFQGRDTLSFMGLDSYTKRWKRLTTYGGKLAADATQATARELLAHDMMVIDKKYPIILQVHDEVLTEVPDTDDYTVKELVGMMSLRPDWIDDRLPLAADGFEAYRYRKE